MTRAYWIAGALSLTLMSGARAEGALQHLEVDTASGRHIFQVELMRSEEDREKGLMFRRSLADDHGMLFDFPHDEPLVFWMKNTYIPLDMIFIARDGHVVSIKHDAKPMDETLISSGVPAAGVLEINAGLADKIGIKVGDEMKHPMFHAAAAAQ